MNFLSTLLPVLLLVVSPIGVLGSYCRYPVDPQRETRCLFRRSAKVLNRVGTSDNVAQKDANVFHFIWGHIDGPYIRGYQFAEAGRNDADTCKDYITHYEKLVKYWTEHAKLLPKVKDAKLIQMKSGPDDGQFTPAVLERNNEFVVSQAIAIIDSGAYYKEGTCVPPGLPQLNAQVHYPKRCPKYKDRFQKALTDSQNAIQEIRKSYEKCPKNKRAFTA